MDHCEFEASLVYRASSRTGSKATEKPCPKKQSKTNKQKKIKVKNACCSRPFSVNRGYFLVAGFLCSFGASLETCSVDQADFKLTKPFASVF